MVILSSVARSTQAQSFPRDDPLIPDRSHRVASLTRMTEDGSAAAPWASGLLDGLNPAQREAAEAVQGPVAILAGAGTGKTRTITHRIANQVATGLARPDQILAVTFTERAAAELDERLQGLGLPGRVRATTFHAAAWAQLRYFWRHVDDGPLPEVLPSKLRLLIPLARRVRAEATDLAAEIEWAKARRLAPDGYAAAAAQRDTPLPATQMAEVYAAYEERKAAEGLLDYEDMLLRTTTALETVPEVADGVRDRYRFFTVDEFQDVNPAQFALLRAWLGDGREACVVGDDDQTIYRFTGASPDYLVRFGDHFPDARTVALTANYRSTPEVLTLANRVLWTKPRHQRKSLEATLPAGPPPTFSEHADDEEERVAVVAEVRRLLAEGVPAGEIAICYRINSQSEPFEEALRAADISYVLRGEPGFFARREVAQALGVLRLAAQREPTADPLALPGTTAAAPPRADAEVERILREQAGWHPRREPSGEAARERWQNLGALVGLVERLVAEQPSLSLAEVVADLDRRAAAGQETADPDGAVTLLTLHRAKGLEFDAVFLVALEEGLLPISHAKTDEEVEDERRLLYVGVTRARRHLWLSWARRRPGFRGRVVARRPSRLIYGLGPGAPTSGAAAGGTKGAARPAGGTGRTCGCGAPLISAAERRAARCTRCQAGAGGDVDPQLAEALRDWRRQRARRDEVPAFVVCNDRTLVEIAARRPTTPEELLGVHGFGPAKVERYGEDVLALVRASG
jgi:DNA helicase II / ATP-dependent DNA helicase PcrA